MYDDLALVKQFFSFVYYAHICSDCEWYPQCSIMHRGARQALHLFLYFKGNFLLAHLEVVCHVASERVSCTGTVLCVRTSRIFRHRWRIQTENQSGMLRKKRTKLTRPTWSETGHFGSETNKISHSIRII